MKTLRSLKRAYSLRLRDHSYDQAFAELDQALANNARSNNAEKIAAIRKVAFADVDEFVASGKLAALLKPVDEAREKAERAALKLQTPEPAPQSVAQTPEPASEPQDPAPIPVFPRKRVPVHGDEDYTGHSYYYTNPATLPKFFREGLPPSVLHQPALESQ